MKKLFALITILVLSMTTLAEAKKVDPCKTLVDSCKKAGFTERSSKNGKGTRSDCVKPIVEGKTVAGVTATPEEIASCKKIAEKRKEKRKEVQADAVEKRLENHDAK